MADPTTETTGSVSAESYNIIVTEDTDTTPAIKAACINGEDYKFDYNSLKNRPCYIRKTCGPILLGETDLTFQESAMNGSTVHIGGMEVEEDIMGEVWYRVTIDGVSYDCESAMYQVTGTQSVAYIGDMTLMSGIGQGDVPFFIMKEGPMLGIITKVEGETHRVSVQHLITETKLLDRELIPKIYFRGSMPVDFSTALNMADGKFGFEMTLKSNEWRRHSANVIYYNFAKAENDYRESSGAVSYYMDYPIVFCLLAHGYTDEQAVAFASLTFLTGAWGNMLFAVGKVPLVDIPVQLFYLGAAPAGFTNEKKAPAAEPSPEENEGGDDNGSENGDSGGSEP